MENTIETLEAHLEAALDLLARRSMECAGCCGPSAKADEYQDYLTEARADVARAVAERATEPKV